MFLMQVFLKEFFVQKIMFYIVLLPSYHTSHGPVTVSILFYQWQEAKDESMMNGFMKNNVIFLLMTIVKH